MDRIKQNFAYREPIQARIQDLSLKGAHILNWSPRVARRNIIGIFYRFFND